MQVIRKFSVEVVALETTEGAFTPGVSYRVLALDMEGETLFLLLADDDGNLGWVTWDQVRVTTIED